MTFRAAPAGNIAGRDLAFVTEQLQGCTLTAAEAVRLSAKWWDERGRKIINRAFNHERKDTFSGATSGGPAIRVRGSEEVVIPSRVLEGRPWDELDRRERREVVRAWLAANRALYAQNDGPRVSQ